MIKANLNNAAVERLDYWRKKAAELELFAKKSGSLRRQELWELEYFRNPYLTFASDEYLTRRMIDHFHNQIRLTADGKLGLTPFNSSDSNLLLPLFSHLQLEFAARGGTPVDTISVAVKELQKYDLDGPPRGVRLFSSLPETLPNVIVKFSKQECLSPLLNHGLLRLTPSPYYNGTGLSKAMKDNETEREFHVADFDAAAKGKTSVPVAGFEAALTDGFWKLITKCSPYLLWSACEDIDRRLPDDFHADAALVIKDRGAFAQKVRAAIAGRWPHSKTWFGRVKYYDPCSFVSHTDRPESIKHFSYLYQREWRICVFVKDGLATEPINIELGSLRDIAELITE